MIVQRYDEAQVKSVPISTGPSAQGAPADTFGLGLGAGMAHAGNSGFDIASEMQKQDAQTKAYDFRVKLDEHENAIKFGDPGEEGAEGFLKINGSESMQYKDTYLEDFKEKALKEIPEDASPFLRLALEKMVSERHNQLTNEFGRHAIAQESQANDQASGAMTASILRNISSNPYDDNRFQTELGILKHVVDQEVTKKYGENNETANAIRKSKLELAVNDAYSKRLNRILLDDPAKGKQFLDDNTGTGTLTPETVDHYTQILKPLVANQNGIQAAFEMVDRLKLGEPVDKLIAEGQKKMGSRPEEFKVFEAQLRSAENDIRNGNIRSAQTAAAPLQKMIIDLEKDGGKATPAQIMNSQEYKSLVALGTPEALTLASNYSDKVYQEHRTVLAERRMVNREDRLERKEDRLREEFDAKESRQLEFTRLSLNPDDVASMTDFEVGQKVIELGPTLGGQLRKMKAKLSDPEALAKVKIENKTFTSLMDQLGVTNKSKQSAYYSAVQDYIVAQQQEGKRVFNPKQVREAVVGAMQDVEVAVRTKNWLDDGYSDAGTVTKKRIDVQNPAAIVIPKEDLKTITDYFASHKITDTPAARAMAYDQLLTDKGIRKLKQKR